MKTINGVYTSAKIFTDIIEDYALAQIQMLCDNEAFKGCKIRVMPDVHPGKVGTIGFTSTIGKRILPNVVGSDIGCGILLAKLKQKKTEFQKLDKVIRENIPVGKVRCANAMFYNEENPFMLADVDRMVVGENAGLECKTASPYMADKWKDGNIPLSYQIQCYHYMAVSNADAWYLAVVIYGREFKYYKIERDAAVIADLIQIEKTFWENHVLKQQIPDPDGSKLADSVIAEYYKNSIADTIPLTGFNEKLERRQELSELIGRMDMEKKKIEQELKLYLGENERAENEQFMVSWKSVQSNRLDEKRLKEEEPEIYEKYKKSVSSRRFTVKAA